MMKNILFVGLMLIALGVAGLSPGCGVATLVDANPGNDHCHARWMDQNAPQSPLTLQEFVLVAALLAVVTLPEAVFRAAAGVAWLAPRLSGFKPPLPPPRFG